LIPLGVASREVCGEKTLIPLADKRRRDACKGSERVMLLRPRKIWPSQRANEMRSGNGGEG
jgi:hypothetical protein